jgi:hypothetical protein
MESMNIREADCCRTCQNAFYSKSPLGTDYWIFCLLVQLKAQDQKLADPAARSLTYETKTCDKFKLRTTKRNVKKTKNKLTDQS